MLRKQVLKAAEKLCESTKTNTENYFNCNCKPYDTVGWWKVSLHPPVVKIDEEYGKINSVDHKNHSTSPLQK